MNPIDVKSPVVTDSVASSSCQPQPLSARPSGSPPAAPLDPERVTNSKLHEFCKEKYGPSEMPLSIEGTLAFLYSQPNMLIHAERENDLELLNILLDISIKTQTEEEGDNILHRMAELKRDIKDNIDLIGNNIFFALAKNRWPEAHLATADHAKTWTADQWLAFLEDIKDIPVFNYTPFNVHDLLRDDWKKITKDWDLEEKLSVFNKLIHLSSTQPSDPYSQEYSPYILLAKMKKNAKTRKEIVIGFINEDVDYFCNFLSALERFHNPDIYQIKQDCNIEKDRSIIRNPSSWLNSIFLATHPLASEFSTYFDKPLIEQGQLSPIWLSTLITLAEHNHGKLVLDIIKSVKIENAAFWNSLLEVATTIVEGGELAELAEKAVPGKIDLKLIQSCKASTEELKKLNAHEWECCAKTKTGHIFRPNYNELTGSYQSHDFMAKFFPAIAPALDSSEENLKPFSLHTPVLSKPNPFSGIKIHSFGTSVSNPAQFSLPDPFTLEAALRAKCRHFRILRFPREYTSEHAKKSVPLLSLNLSKGIANDRIFTEVLLEDDVVISQDKEIIHDSFFHLLPIINAIFKSHENTYVEYRDQRRELSRKALTLIDNDTKLSDEMQERILKVLGAMNDVWNASPSHRPDFEEDLLFIFKKSSWCQYFRKKYEGIDLDMLRKEALRVFAPLL